jgi:hypothetical protein
MQRLVKQTAESLRPLTHRTSMTTLRIVVRPAMMAALIAPIEIPAIQ